MCQMRAKQKNGEALELYVKESRNAKIYKEQDRRVRNSRKRNGMLQRAGEAALAEADLAGKASAKNDFYLRQDKLLAVEMGRRNRDRETRQREIQRICENDEQLRELQLKLKAAYMNKERHMQLEQKRNNFASERRQEDVFNENRERERLTAEENERRKLFQQRQYSLQQAKHNNDQIQEKLMRDQEDAYNEFMHDKQTVDKLMADISNELQFKESDRLKKKDRLRTDMNQSLKDRAEQLCRRRDEDAAADVASKEYRQIQDIRKKRAKLKAAAAAEAAAKIFNKLKTEAERKLAEENRISLAIELLRKEDADRRRDEVSRKKREKEQRSKLEMMEANEAQKLHKIQMRAREMEEEQTLVSRMMSKFKEDERKEKMEELERHQAKLNYKLNILDQMEEKRVKYEAMLAKDQRARQVMEKEKVYREQVVEEARRRLLTQHAAALRDFLPKGVVQKMSDLALLDTNGDGVISDAEALAARRKMTEYGDLNGDGILTEDEKVYGFEQFKASASRRQVHFKAQPPVVPPPMKGGPMSTQPW